MNRQPRESELAFWCRETMVGLMDTIFALRETNQQQSETISELRETIMHEQAMRRESMKAEGEAATVMNALDDYSIFMATTNDGK